jgi:hypothetical protein
LDYWIFGNGIAFGLLDYWKRLRLWSIGNGVAFGSLDYSIIGIWIERFLN